MKEPAKEKKKIEEEETDIRRKLLLSLSFRVNGSLVVINDFIFVSLFQIDCFTEQKPIMDFEHKFVLQTGVVKENFFKLIETSRVWWIIGFRAFADGELVAS